MQNASVAFHAKGWVLWVQKAGGKGAIIVGEGKARCFVAPFGFGASLPNCLLACFGFCRSTLGLGLGCLRTPVGTHFIIIIYGTSLHLFTTKLMLPQLDLR